MCSTFSLECEVYPVQDLAGKRDLLYVAIVLHAGTCPTTVHHLSTAPAAYHRRLSGSEIFSEIHWSPHTVKERSR